MWLSWWETAGDCPTCEISLDRHGWLAAMWINTWFTMSVVMAWIIGGLVITRGEGGIWVTGGAIWLALLVPIVMYRYAKSLMLRLLFRLDPPEGTP